MLFITTEVARINGRRRTRLVTSTGVAKAVVEVALGKREHVVVSADSVANSYGYPAVRSVVLVYRSGDRVCMFAREANASGGTGVGTHLRGEKLTPHAHESATPVNLAEAVEILTGAKFDAGTPDGVLVDFLLERGF